MIRLLFNLINKTMEENIIYFKGKLQGFKQQLSMDYVSWESLKAIGEEVRNLYNKIRDIDEEKYDREFEAEASNIRWQIGKKLLECTLKQLKASKTLFTRQKLPTDYLDNLIRDKEYILYSDYHID